jgi:hypothetical protein
MNRAVHVAGLVATAVVLAAADAREAAGFFFLGGLAAFLGVLVGLPVALALHAHRPSWIAAQSRALAHRTTACALVGAGVLFAALFLAKAFQPGAPAIAWLVVAVSAAWFYVGFAGCARRHGERMLGVAEGGGELRPLLLGWLARAGLFAVPVAWPFVAMWLVVVAFGAPVVATFGRRSKAPPPISG